MDHFESIISTLLGADHYWVRRSFEISVTPEEKRQVGKHSIPRPEIEPRGGFGFGRLDDGGGRLLFGRGRLSGLLRRGFSRSL
jgi:hypothetical protein